MVASVNQYKGFYIGRYETSDLHTASPKVQAKQTLTTNIDWYEMYKNSKEVAKEGLQEEETSSVTSSMIWGCQWDAVMNWFINCGGDTAKYVTDSTDKGYYKQSTFTITGSNEDYAVNNIYDMAGNAYEWTMEADANTGRILHGGRYDGQGSNYPAGYRIGCTAERTDHRSDSRVTLYVNLSVE